MLDVCDLFVKTLIFKSVCIHLCLVILELSNHVLELLSALLKILLIHLQLLGDLGPGLLREYVLKLDVELLLLLDEHVLLRHLLRLRDQSLLQRLNFLDQFVGLRVSALKLAPPVHVQRLVELVREELGFLLLFQELLLQQEDFTAEVRDASRFVLRDDEETLEL